MGERMGDSTGDRVLPQPPRFWTVAEANARLPTLRTSLARLRSSAARVQAVMEERERLAAFWGDELRSVDQIDRPLLDRLESELETVHAKLEEEVGALRNEGIEVKDLGSGLVDFYGVVDQEVVFLCWRLGESEVGHYHRLDGGFRTRQPLGGRPRDAAPDARRRVP
jgi:hypothetical protein